jgi:hypothetical protein
LHFMQKMHMPFHLKWLHFMQKMHKMQGKGIA